ncbi:MAG: hypothetical protein U1C46_01890 [Bacteroidales bacterium]|nr:hypothetical protein [Bacteroidales bacterium]
MKKATLLLSVLALFGLSALAQSVNIATLHKTTGVQNFTGTLALRLAYTASSNGDTIYLSGGTFNSPDTINKRLVIIGAGHYPDSTLATGKTIVSGRIVLDDLADNSYIEGIHFLAHVYFANNKSVNNFTIKRCRIDGDIRYFGGIGTNTCNNNIIIECVISQGGNLDFNNARSLTVSKCLFFNYTNTLNNVKMVTFTNNIFFNTNGTYFIYSADNSLFKNNIFKVMASHPVIACTGTYFANNVWLGKAVTDYGVGNTAANNYSNVTYDNFFENQTGNDFSYSHNYRLKTPASFPGDDGTQVGIYGTTAPYKDGAVPSNPHIRSKSIAVSTNLNGNLEVQVKVAAQQQ